MRNVKWANQMEIKLKTKKTIPGELYFHHEEERYGHTVFNGTDGETKPLELSKMGR